MGVVTGVLMAIGLNQLLVSKLEMARLPLPYLLGGAKRVLPARHHRRVRPGLEGGDDLIGHWPPAAHDAHAFARVRGPGRAVNAMLAPCQPY
ncbi:hypothetical protein LP419_16805 [Massilia sp. H-1]|nr:hypothetical protein LP419_16805 [Massilia sp. H-1]